MMYELLIIFISAIVGIIATDGKKTQFVRLIDVFIYGPVLIYIGFYGVEYYLYRYILLILGTTTITYNLKNFISNL
jgi:hypothetical protein